MPACGLNVELDIDTTVAAFDTGTVTFDWFDAMSRIAFGDARKALDGEGTTPIALPYMEPETWNPSRAPVQLRSIGKAVEVVQCHIVGVASSATRRRPGAGRRQRLLTAGSEPDSPNVWYPSLYASRPAESPGWVRLGAYVAESAFLDRAHGADIQRQWLSGVRTFADWLNPGIGQIEYGYDTFGTTGLEFSLPPSIDCSATLKMSMSRAVSGADDFNAARAGHVLVGGGIVPMTRSPIRWPGTGSGLGALRADRSCLVGNPGRRRFTYSDESCCRDCAFVAADPDTRESSSLPALGLS